MIGDSDAIQASQHSRRDFLKGAGLLAGGLAVGGVAGFALNETITDDDGVSGEASVATQDLPPLDESEVPLKALVYFSIPHARIVQALAARLFPSDENGPGALEAGVVYYIDRQLAGTWGSGDQWYMRGPFVPGESTQGWQYHLTPRDAYQAGLTYLEEHCQQEYGDAFVDLTVEQQAEVITLLEAGEIDTFRSLASREFFTMLRTNTLEGMYCDPLHGGNHNMVGWRMKKYPGSYLSYRDRITEDEFLDLPPQPLEAGHLGTLSPAETGARGSLRASHNHHTHPLDVRAQPTVNQR